MSSFSVFHAFLVFIQKPCSSLSLEFHQGMMSWLQNVILREPRAVPCFKTYGRVYIVGIQRAFLGMLCAYAGFSWGVSFSLLHRTAAEVTYGFFFNANLELFWKQLIWGLGKGLLRRLSAHTEHATHVAIWVRVSFCGLRQIIQQQVI